jgi:hypothetical protein
MKVITIATIATIKKIKKIITDRINQIIDKKGRIILI